MYLLCQFDLFTHSHLIRLDSLECIQGEQQDECAAADADALLVWAAAWAAFIAQPRLNVAGCFQSHAKSERERERESVFNLPAVNRGQLFALSKWITL